MLLSVVIPVYNEQEVLPHLFTALQPVLSDLGTDFEIILVNDGSRDRSAQIIQEIAAENHRIKLVSFSRNFGHQAAITAGLDFASGDAVVIMDADLQDPPELLREMLNKFREGYDVVSCQRVSRAGESFFKRKTATAFYELMRRAVDKRIPPEVGDFRLFSRGAVMAIRGFREQHRFLRGLVAWLGLREAIIPFHRPARVAGETKYPMHKMFKLAWTAISSFSALPLKLCLYAGLGMTLAGVLYSGYAVYAAMFQSSTVPGWSSLVCIQLLFNGATLTAVGLVGDYVGRVYEESKQRPLYVVNETANVRTASTPARAAIVTNQSSILRPLTDDIHASGVDLEKQRLRRAG